MEGYEESSSVSVLNQCWFPGFLLLLFLCNHKILTTVLLMWRHVGLVHVVNALNSRSESGPNSSPDRGCAAYLSKTLVPVILILGLTL